jgi:GntR family transcriptional regulator, transcriptional repressor for pyruvate dehydrogenase complex
MTQATEKITAAKFTVPSLRTFEQVANHIRKKILSGALKPGDKLAPERDMAKQFEVGRNAIREALRDLESKGIVRLEKGRGGGQMPTG